MIPAICCAVFARMSHDARERFDPFAVHKIQAFWGPSRFRAKIRLRLRHNNKFSLCLSLIGNGLKVSGSPSMPPPGFFALCGSVSCAS
jgi:hypothetical protein